MLPKHSDLWRPALDILADGQDHHLRDFEAPLAEHFGLSAEEQAEMYPSGNGPIFFDRIGWALSYLSLADLVDKPKRGIYRINDTGRAMLDKPGHLDGYILGKRAERERRKEQDEAPVMRSATPVRVQDEASALTPQEQLYASFEGILRSVYDDILDTILSKTPREFEHLVVQLLQKMGYGGQIENAGEVTQYSNDGGIDGVIKEDVLGLGRVHIQAKRYKRDNTIGREEIQKFVGALAVAQSKKGVFITTSRYTPAAIEYAESLHGNTTVVLIDGEALAGYIYDYGLGMQVEQTIEIKKLDSDFWDRIQDA